MVSMHLVLREAKETDMPLVERLAVETGWKGIPETQRKLLNREKWDKHMVEVFEDISKGKNSEIFIAEDEQHGFIGYLFVGESGDMMTGLSFGFIYDIFVKKSPEAGESGSCSWKKRRIIVEARVIPESHSWFQLQMTLQ
jgi:hypothetical protein